MSLTDPSARSGSGSGSGSGNTSHGQNEYSVPKPGRLNLRETRAERNERIRKSAEKEFRDHEAAIRKANKTHLHHNSEKRGRGSRSEYTDDEMRTLERLGPGDDFFISRGVGHLLHDDGDDEGDYSGSNVFRGLGDEGMGVEASLAGRHTSHQGRMPDVRIPSRYANTHTHTQGQAHASTSAALTSRSTFTFTHTTSGTNNRSTSSSFQEYSQQSEREYRDGIYRQMEWVRSHRSKQKSQAEAQERKAAQEAEYMRQILEAEKEERRREKREKERRRDRERAFEEGEEGRKSRRGSTPIYDQFDSRGNMAQAGPASKTGAKESELRRKERERYLSRWKSLLSTDNDDGGDGDGDGIIETELSYKDIPWPIYQKSNLDTTSIKTFLSSFTSGSSTSSRREQERKIYREAIRNFHPDRFNSKVLPRVREGERDKVKEGMEVCSRVLTGLISDNSASR